MNPLSCRLICRQKFATCVLLLGMLIQLGACPCGCLEHNVWFQLIGLDSEHEHDVPGSDTVWDAEHHDCTGEPRAQYINNARSAQDAGKFIDNIESTLVIFESAHQTCQGFSRFYQKTGPFALAHAPSFSTLQVYRL